VALVMALCWAWPAQARADNIAVQVKSAWSARAKLLAAFVRYELCYRHSALFFPGKTHKTFPRAFGLASALGKADHELILRIPDPGKKSGKIKVTVTVRQRGKVKRLLAEGHKDGWVPAKGWDKKEWEVDLGEARLAVKLTRQGARQEIRKLKQKLEAFEAKHPMAGKLTRKALAKVIDLGEEMVDSTLVAMVHGRYLAAQFMQGWSPPALPAEAEPPPAKPGTSL